LKNRINNRMSTAEKAPWIEAKTVTVPLIVVLCPVCGSPKTITRKTVPDAGTEYRQCNKCGNKFWSHPASRRVRLIGNQTVHLAR
jgi:predicted RNA-binding Zn-ribbon protein involved in translation (DUF1610 family)